MKKIDQFVTAIFVIGMLLALTGHSGAVKNLGYLMGAIIASIFIWRICKDWVPWIINKNKKFEERLIEQGFTDRIVVYDFFPLSTQKRISWGFGWEHWWTVGVWLNYHEELIALRTDKDSWDAIIVPFKKIKRVQYLPDEYTKTYFRGVVVGGFVFSNSESKGISEGMQVGIVVGDPKHGTDTYFLNLYDSSYSGKMNQSDSDYRAIVECAQSIYSEINKIRPPALSQFRVRAIHKSVSNLS